MPVRRRRRRGFNPWVQKSPWRRAWLPTPVFLAGKSHGQRSLVGYSPQGREELNSIEWLGVYTTEYRLSLLSYSRGKIKVKILKLYLYSLLEKKYKNQQTHPKKNRKQIRNFYSFHSFHECVYEALNLWSQYFDLIPCICISGAWNVIAYWITSAKPHATGCLQTQQNVKAIQWVVPQTLAAYVSLLRKQLFHHLIHHLLPVA